MAHPNLTVDARCLGGMYAKVLFATDTALVNTIAPGTQRTAFLDRLGQNIASGFPAPITRSEANFFGGEVPARTSIIAYGCQIGVVEQALNGVVLDPAVPSSIASLQHNVSVTLNIKGSSYVLGSPMTMPCGHGSSGLPKNGGPGVQYFRFPDSLPLELGPTDRFEMVFRVERQITLQTINGSAMYYVYLPALTAIDLSQLSAP